jgi:hypothetical protein
VWAAAINGSLLNQDAVLSTTSEKQTVIGLELSGIGTRPGGVGGVCIWELILIALVIVLK